MRIIDSQIHCYYPDTPETPWPAGVVNPHGSQFTIEQALDLMDRSGVEGAILVPPVMSGWWDNQYSLDAAVSHPDRFAVMVRPDIDASGARQRLRLWRDQPGMIGVRVYIRGQPWEKLLDSPDYRWFWETANETRLPVMAHCPGGIHKFRDILQAYPDLRLMIDHAGRDPDGPKDDPAWDDAASLHALARFPNVAVKVSSLPSFTTDGYPFPRLHGHIRRIHDSFGPQRMLWGSDVTRLSSSYEDNMRLFTEALDFLCDSDREWIMGRAALHWCDWNPAARPATGAKA